MKKILSSLVAVAILATCLTSLSWTSNIIMDFSGVTGATGWKLMITRDGIPEPTLSFPMTQTNVVISPLGLGTWTFFGVATNMYGDAPPSNTGTNIASPPNNSGRMVTIIVTP